MHAMTHPCCIVRCGNSLYLGNTLQDKPTCLRNCVDACCQVSYGALI